MKTEVGIALLVAMLALPTMGFAMGDQNLTEQYIVECSRQWTESTATGDTSPGIDHVWEHLRPYQLLFG